MTTIYLVVWESDEYEDMYDIDSVWMDKNFARQRLDRLNQVMKYNDFSILALEVNKIHTDFELRQSDSI